MSVPAEIKAQTEAKLAYYLSVAHSHYPNHKLVSPKLSFDKSTQRAGAFCTKTNTLFLSEYFMDPRQGHVDEMLDVTLPHEIAHWLDYSVNGTSYSRGGRRQLHGPKWRSIMRNVFNLPPEVTHRMELRYEFCPKIKKRESVKFSYSCNCDELHMITKYKHNKILNGSHYRCVRCKSRIQQTKG